MKKKKVPYWNLIKIYLMVLCILWFVVGIGLTILWAEHLNNMNFGGVPFGLWFATQGVFIVFVFMLFMHNRIIEGIHKRYNAE